MKKELKQLRKGLTNKGLALILIREVEIMQYTIAEVLKSDVKMDIIMDAVNFEVRVSGHSELTKNEFWDLICLAKKM